MEVRHGCLEGVVEPAAEIVVTSAGIGLAEECRQLLCNFGVIEEGQCRGFGGREGRGNVVKD